jgi:hypothetical protein
VSEEPLTPRPAATVMLIRDTAEGIKTFLMRRHMQMEFVAASTTATDGHSPRVAPLLPPRSATSPGTAPSHRGGPRNSASTSTSPKH